jgi:hypothetical protein
MKHLLPPLAALLLAAALPPPAAAQEGGAPRGSAEIQGRVVAAETGAPLPNATVSARSETDTVVAARAVTGADGRFRLPGLAPGRYVVRASLAGRQAATSAPTGLATGGAAADVGDLRLSAAVLLDALQVRAERPAVVHAEDRNIYSIKDLPAASAAAADVMRTIPELEVDNNGAISMVGNRSVTIHINGRPSPLRGEALTEFIKHLPADRIDRIEVLPNPSVRYEGGSDAIVNIVLKKGVQLGLSGSMSANTATRGGNGLSGQLAYQRGRLTLFGGGAGRLFRSDDRSREIRENLQATPATFLDQDRRFDNQSTFGSGDITAELDVGPKQTLWGSASVNRGGFGGDGTSFYRQLDADGAPLRIFDHVTDNESSWGSSELALGFRHVAEPQKHELSVEVRRNSDDGSSDARFEETTSMRVVDDGGPLSQLRLTDSNRDETGWTGKVDYVRPLWAGARLESGVRSEREESSERNRLRIFAPMEAAGPSESTGQAFHWRQDQHSAYANLGGKLGRLSWQGGLRAEWASVELAPKEGESTVQRDYFSLFPSANLSIPFGEGRDLRINYSKRVNRPWIGNLNPFIPRTDPLNIRIGNPDLDPSETHSVGMDLSVRASLVTLRLSPYFRHSSGEVVDIRTVDSAGVSTTIPQNLATVDSYGSMLNASLRPTDRSTVSATVGVTRTERDAGELGSFYSVSGTSTFLSANGTFQAADGLGLQGSFRVSGPRQTPQGRFSSTVWSDVGIRKDLFGDKSSLNVRVTDPLGIFRTSFVSRDPTFSSTSRNRNSWGGRSASVSFTYRFGTTPKRRSTEGGGQGGQQGGGSAPSGE